MLHDEKTGWARLDGNSRYENAGKELKTIPGSTFFQFQGMPRTGMTIAGESNRLRLNIEPIPLRASWQHDGAAIWMGTAPAVLPWQGRTIPGRVIYEYLMMPDFNRLRRTYWDLWKRRFNFPVHIFSAV